MNGADKGAKQAYRRELEKKGQPRAGRIRFDLPATQVSQADIDELYLTC